MALAVALMFPVSVGPVMAAPTLELKIPGDSGRAARNARRLDNPRGIAVDAERHRVYVAEEGNNRISVFSPDGEFLWAFGGGVRDGRSSSLQRCRRSCADGTEGSAPGQFKGPRGVALDPRGDIYVVDEGNFRVQKFTPSGRFLWMVGGGVNRASGGNLCTRAERASCGGGHQGSGAGEFRDWDAGNFIAVDRSGRVLVGDKSRIEVFAPDGHFKSEIRVPRRKNVGSLGVEERTGDIYYAYSQFWTKDAHVYKLSPSGRELCSANVPGPTALATRETGGAFVVSERIGAETGEMEPEIVELSSDCRVTARFARPPAGAALNSLASDSARLYVGTYEFEAPRSYISVYASPSGGGLRWATALELLRVALRLLEPILIT